MFGRIDHIGVAVDDLDEAVSLYSERLGMPVQHRETVEQQGVEAVLHGHAEPLRVERDGLIEVVNGHADVIDPPEHGLGG